MLRRALVSLVVIAANVRDARPCSISAAPGAHAYGPTAKPERGHRPWIRLSNVPPSEGIQLSMVDAKCPMGTLCKKGKAVPFARAGNFVRPKQALPNGARVQVAKGKDVLLDFVVTSDAAKSELPAWEGTLPPKTTTVVAGKCSPAGAQITLPVKPTKADLTDAVLLVYLRKPDAKRPEPGIAAIYKLGSEPSVTLQGSIGDEWLANKPATIWIALADGDGHIGPAVELAL